MIQSIVLAARIVSNALPVVGMILLIPFIENDYILALVYVVVILIALAIHQDERDRVFVIFGFIASFMAEALFTSTGVETFERRTLFGIMPLWLPILWAYVFMAMRRAVEALNSYLQSQPASS